MNPPLPSEIVVESLRHGARYSVPPRAMGKASWLGFVPVIFGFGFAGFAIFWISIASWMISKSPQKDWFVWLFPLFGVPFVLVGIGIIRASVFTLAGRYEIEVSEGQLRVTERAWLFRKNQTVRTDKLRRISVEVLPFSPINFYGPAKLAALKIELSEGKPVELLRGYPLKWLEALAHELATRCSGLNITAPTVNVVTEPLPPRDLGQPDKRDYPDQPVGSQVQLVERPDGFTLTMPPAGLVRGSKGLFAFAILWNTFMSVFTTIFLFAKGSQTSSGEPMFWLLIIVFWSIGVGLFIPAINMGRRRAVFMIAGDQLRLAHANLFGTKLSAWSRDELKSIHIGPSGMAVNDIPVLELQIEPRAGKKVGLLSGRDEDELRWIATTLRRGLRLETPKVAA